MIQNPRRAPYQPYKAEFYEQQLTIYHNDKHLQAKVARLLEKVKSRSSKSPKNIQGNDEGTVQNQPQMTESDARSNFIRKELGTQKDGSMGAWGGKKYGGLGMQDVAYFEIFRNSPSSEKKQAAISTKIQEHDFN